VRNGRGGGCIDNLRDARACVSPLGAIGSLPSVPRINLMMLKATFPARLHATSRAASSDSCWTDPIHGGGPLARGSDRPLQKEKSMPRPRSISRDERSVRLCWGALALSRCTRTSEKAETSS